ncbi:hypothetical protein ACFXOZ_40350, partial [Kitasatospora sp. NPDC059160]
VQLAAANEQATRAQPAPDRRPPHPHPPPSDSAAPPGPRLPPRAPPAAAAAATPPTRRTVRWHDVSLRPPVPTTSWQIVA